MNSDKGTLSIFKFDKNGLEIFPPDGEWATYNAQGIIQNNHIHFEFERDKNTIDGDSVSFCMEQPTNDHGYIITTARYQVSDPSVNYDAIISNFALKDGKISIGVMDNWQSKMNKVEIDNNRVTIKSDYTSIETPTVKLSNEGNGVDIYNGGEKITINNKDTFNENGYFIGKQLVQDYEAPSDLSVRYSYPVSSSWDAKSKVCFVAGTSNNNFNIYGAWGTTGNTTSRTVATSTSDARLKKDITDSEINALPQILQIPHKEFNWRGTNEHVDNGYVAQDLMKINPNMVFKPEENLEGSYYGINTYYLESLITKSIQEMYYENEKRFKAIEDRLERLEKKIDSLTAK